MTAQTLSEEQMVGILRNALVIAGQEMGEKGDHWPVIKATVLSLANDWENLKIEREVDAEMKNHLYHELSRMEEYLDDCSPKFRASLEPKLIELREIYDAYFTKVPASSLYVDDKDIPTHIQRAEIILETLDGETHGE